MKKGQRIKLGLLNVQSGISTTKGYWQYLLHFPQYFFSHSSKSITKVAKLVKDKRFDIFMTTEIDQGSKRTAFIDQVYQFSKYSGLVNFEFFSAFIKKNRINQGNSIHSKLKIIKNEKYKLPGKGEPRYLGKSEIEILGKTITFFVTHLSLNKNCRTLQIKEIFNRLNKIKTPVILGGDFNTCKEKEFDIFSQIGLKKILTAKTFPVWKPKKRLDYIFASPEVKILEGKVLNYKLSDHCMLVCDITL